MKTIKFTLLFIFIATIANAQVPAIEWEKCFGGTSYEFGSHIIQTSDGGYIAAGKTVSTDYDAVDNHGGYDVFVVKLSANSTTEWIKCLGGSYDESAHCIIETSDHGFILAGSTLSNDGDVSGNHGASDGWVVKLDSSGEIEWQKCYGDTCNDVLHTIFPTDDGGYMCFGNIELSDQHLINPQIKRKGWALKIDSLGNVESSQTYGGTSRTSFNAVTPTRDGGYFIAGVKITDGSDVAKSWFLKINEAGTFVWGRDYGIIEDTFYGVTQLADGSLIAVGKNLYDGEMTVVIEKGIVLKFSESGTFRWRKEGTQLGTKYYSVAVVSNNHFVIGGHCPNTTDEDIVLIKMTYSGNVVWQKYYGGENAEYFSSFQQTKDHGFILTARTFSQWTGYHGGSDMWIAKLSPETGIVELDPTLQFQVYPNPTQNILNIQIDPALLNTPYKVYSITGQLVLSGNLTAETMQLNLESFTEGVYLLQVGNQTQKIVKMN